MCSPSIRPPEFVRDGRTVPSPEVTHIMASMLKLGPADNLLEIGTGSASQTVEWAKSGCEVHTIELSPVIEPWQVHVGKDQVYAHIGNGKHGLPKEAPFSAIVATCGIEAIPDAWKDQLKPLGRMVVPIGTSSCQRLTLFEKDEEGTFRPQKIAGYVRFSMMR